MAPVMPNPTRRKPGRPRKSLDELQRGNSRWAKTRLREAIAGGHIAHAAKHPDAPVPSLKAIEQSARTGIPGYDPWRASAGYVFDAKVARDYVAFFHRELTILKGPGAGGPFILLPWQRAIVANVFGLRVKGDPSKRRYQRALIYVPKKQGKSPLCGGLGAACLLKEQQPGAEIYGAASTYKQAAIVFNWAKSMVTRNPALRQRVQTFKSSGNLCIKLEDHPANVDDIGVYKPIAADSESADGVDATHFILDELHRQDNPEFVDLLERSFSACPNPLGIYITTADYNRDSVCNEKLDYAKAVRDGTQDDPRFLPVIYEASKDDDWRDEAVWHRVNPSLGTIKRLDDMRAMARDAEQNPRKLNDFLRFQLNIVTDTAESWLSIDAWDACAETEPIDLAGRSCYCGLDLSATTDTSAFVAVFPVDGRLHVRAIHWLPRDGAIDLKDRGKRDHVDYEMFARLGVLRLTDGPTVDYARVGDDIWAFVQRHDVLGIAYDPQYARPVENRLVKELGLPEAKWIECRQIITILTVGARAIERGLAAATFRHDRNMLLRTQIASATYIEGRSECIMAAKAAKTRRIDGVTAWEMAMKLVTDADDNQTVYNYGESILL